MTAGHRSPTRAAAGACTAAFAALATVSAGCGSAPPSASTTGDGRATAPMASAAGTASAQDAAAPPEPPLERGEPRIVQVVTGGYHSCVLLEDGTVRCAGNNDHGQLGVGHFDGDKHPLLTPVPMLREVVQIAAGWTHSCAIDRAASVYCWGDDSTRLAGAPRPVLDIGWGTPHIELIAGVKAKQLVLGGYRALAITATGDLVSWGEENEGPDRCRVGQGPPRPCALTPFSLAPPEGIDEVAANGQVACVRTRAGAVWCRGVVLHSGTSDATEAFEPVPGVRDATTIGVGDDHACAAVRHGPLLCWGRNDDGQLGAGTRDTGFDRHLPTPVVGIGGDEVAPSGLALGFHRTCAALRNGSVRCWGAYTLEDGSFDFHADRARWVPRPARVPGLAHVARVVVGATHTCALTRAGRAYCWGENEQGEVADGTREPRRRPVPIAFVAPAQTASESVDRSVVATSIAVSASHSCATATDGKLRCWGSNAGGALGLGAADSDAHERPVVVPGLSAIARVAVTENRTCAIDGARSLYCWGDGSWGAVGDGASEMRAAPVRLALTGVTDVELGFLHGCAIAADGQPRCWGEAGPGQLGFEPQGCSYTPPGDFGLGAPSAPSCLPAPGPTVPGVPVADRVLCSFTHSCAVTRATRDLYCWGALVPELRRRPGPLQGTRAVASARAGDYHGCALSKTGEIWCWGKSSYGELGTGRMVDARAEPARVRGIANATRLWAGGFTTCAGTADGLVQCWGLLPDLGTRSGPKLRPMPVPELTGAVDADFSMFHGCALWADGVVRCWGHSSAGAHGSVKRRLTTATAIRWQ